MVGGVGLVVNLIFHMALSKKMETVKNNPKSYLKITNLAFLNLHLDLLKVLI